MKGRVAAVLVLMMLALTAVLVAVPSPASASVTEYAGARMLDWAEANTLNDSYVYGTDGPGTFDCSGLWYAAAHAVGETGWPRDTYGIAAEIGTRFAITDHPVRGDLAMWGPVDAPYHMEVVTSWADTTFGAENPGWAGRVTWHSDVYFEPSFYLRILY